MVDLTRLFIQAMSKKHDLSTNNPDDFQYHDSAFVVYNGPFQESPWLAAAFWMAIIFVASIIALTVVKFFWFALRKRGLTSNR
jgi:hypothetical protein